MNRLALGMVASLAAACSSSASSPAPAPDAGSPLIAARPYTLAVPPSYDAAKPTPLVLMLHGYGASGLLEDVYMGLTPASTAHGFLYAYADGTKDKSGSQFWNATDACCNLDGSAVDDVAYLDAVLDDVAAKYNVDPKRVYLVGHSNGAFMAQRLACDQAHRFAAIVSLAGAQFADPARCAPSEPVSVLQVHGDKDDTILYGGSVIKDRAGVAHAYPSAHQTVATWATKDACPGALAATGRTLDLDAQLPGSETLEESYGPCASGSTVTLWTIQGGGHVPDIGPSWSESIWTFLSAHPKP